ncbi:MAG: GntR family transcriptional regulator, partial [Bifidobacterium sp.]|nr:GntR family transcriptional regulator [Bifidobacterium sp.]
MASSPTITEPDTARPARVRLPTEETVARIRAIIEDEGLRPGEKVGSERALAQRFNISRSDLRIALAEMEDGHEIVRKIGRTGGIVVSDGKLERNLNTVESLTQVARRQGWRLTSTVLDAAREPATPSDARLLELPADEPRVVAVRRLRLLNGAPLAVERTRLPAYLFPGLLDEDLAGSLYGLFERRYHVRPRRVDESLDCAPADAAQGALLGLADGATTLRLRRVARDE